MIRHTLTLILLSLSVGACVRTRATSTAYRALPPKDVREVQVFTDVAPTRPFEELGLIEVSKFGVGDSYGPLIARAREEAARMGADAIVVVRDPTETTVGQGSVSPIGRGRGQTIQTSSTTVTSPRLRVTAIVFTQPASR